MTNENHYGGDGCFKGIKGMRWLMYVRPIEPTNDACFGISDIKTKDVCAETIAHCASLPITPETLT